MFSFLCLLSTSSVAAVASSAGAGRLDGVWPRIHLADGFLENVLTTDPVVQNSSTILNLLEDLNITGYVPVELPQVSKAQFDRLRCWLTAAYEVGLAEAWTLQLADDEALAVVRRFFRNQLQPLDSPATLAEVYEALGAEAEQIDSEAISRHYQNQIVENYFAACFLGHELLIAALETYMASQCGYDQPKNFRVAGALRAAGGKVLLPDALLVKASRFDTFRMQFSRMNGLVGALAKGDMSKELEVLASVHQRQKSAPEIYDISKQVEFQEGVAGMASVADQAVYLGIYSAQPTDNAAWGKFKDFVVEILGLELNGFNSGVNFDFRIPGTGEGRLRMFQFCFGQDTSGFYYKVWTLEPGSRSVVNVRDAFKLGLENLAANSEEPMLLPSRESLREWQELLKK